MLPAALLTEAVNIRRRRDVGRDSLNNPDYGAPTDGAGWYTVQENFPAKLAFSQRGINFAPEGERIEPLGIMYYNAPNDATFILKPEDRVLTSRGVEYVVVAVTTAYLLGTVVDHYEAKLALP